MSKFIIQTIKGGYQFDIGILFVIWALKFDIYVKTDFSIEQGVYRIFLTIITNSDSIMAVAPQILCFPKAKNGTVV